MRYGNTRNIEPGQSPRDPPVTFASCASCVFYVAHKDNKRKEKKNRFEECIVCKVVRAAVRVCVLSLRRSTCVVCPGCPGSVIHNVPLVVPSCRRGVPKTSFRPEFVVLFFVLCVAVFSEKIARDLLKPRGRNP